MTEMRLFTKDSGPNIIVYVGKIIVHVKHLKQNFIKCSSCPKNFVGFSASHRRGILLLARSYYSGPPLNRYLLLDKQPLTLRLRLKYTVTKLSNEMLLIPVYPSLSPFGFEWTYTAS